MASLAAARPAHRHARRGDLLALQVERLQIGVVAARIGTDVFAESAELVLNCVLRPPPRDVEPLSSEYAVESV